MKVTTVRLPEDLVEDVEEAAEDTGRSQSEYIRHALRIHFEYKPNTDADRVDDRVEQLEARVEALEAGGDGRVGVENAEPPKMGVKQGRGGRSPEREPRGKDGETGSAQLHTIVDDVAEDVLPGAGAKLDDRHDALTAAVTYLIRHESATRAELSEEVYPDHTGRYESGKDPAYSWWKNCILPGLSAIAERSDDVEAADHSGVWRYVPKIPNDT